MPTHTGRPFLRIYVIVTMSIFVHACLPFRINAALLQSVPLISSCGFSLTLGSRLASFVRVRTARTFCLTGGGRVKYAQEQDKRSLFSSMMPISPLSGLVGTIMGVHLSQLDTAENEFRSKRSRNGKTAA